MLWGINHVILGIVGLELAGIGLVYSILQDAKKIKDERENLIWGGRSLCSLLRTRFSHFIHVINKRS